MKLNKTERMQNSSCLVCNNPNFLPYLKGLLKCTSCGFVTTDLKLDKEDMKRIYGKEYFFGNEYVDYKKDKDILQKNFLNRLKTIANYKKGGSLVEVGCAYGFFLELAKKYFSVKGFEICQDAVDFAKGLSLDVESRDFVSAEILKSSVDVVAMWDVVEHLIDPRLYIAKANYILKQDGLLCITTGDIGSLNARIRKEKWRMIHPPTHLHYFSKDTLRLLLEKNGFQIVHQEYISVVRSVKQIAYSLLMLGENRYATLFKVLEKIKLTNLQFSINLRDVVLVVAKKNRELWKLS